METDAMEKENKQDCSENEEAGDGYNDNDKGYDTIDLEEEATIVEVADPCGFCEEVPCDLDTFGDEIPERSVRS